MTPPAALTRRRGLRRRLVVTVAALLATAGVLTAATGSAQAGETAAAPRQYPVGDLGTAVSNFFASPNAVAGANDWNCKPSATHPDPVVLVHATFVNQGANWAQIAPTLANEGHCVFAFNYGMNPVLSLGRIGGMTGVAGSARTMSAFVDKVLAKTGAKKVDLVGHSQGGMMPNYYIKRLGGAAKVDKFVAMAPSNHGTTLNGLVNLGEAIHVLGLVNGFFDLMGLQGLKDQEAGSDFQKALWADGDTAPGVRYAVIQTKNDKVVTPYTNAFLKGGNAENILLQDQCPENPVGHVGLAFDGPTVQNVVNELGADVPGFQPKCEKYGIGF